jgi:seryl-tRNA synthetase
MTPRAASTAQVAFRDRMFEAGVLVPMGVDGLVGKGRAFVEVFSGLEQRLAHAAPGEDYELFRFPPLIPRSMLVQTDYLRSFPDLVGSIHSFTGTDADHAELLRLVEDGGDWAQALSTAEVVLLPAACYPLYPMVAGTPLPEGGRRFDVLGTCFRHEPSADAARMQVFHQREFVRVGSPEDTIAFRDTWLERALELLTDLGLDVRSEVANDPFFGRAGRMLAANQRQGALKFEVVATVGDAEQPTAIASCNCHQDHLGGAFGVHTADGEVAHSACVGFGMERITLALFSAHGTELDGWPAAVRAQLWP